MWQQCSQEGPNPEDLLQAGEFGEGGMPTSAQGCLSVHSPGIRASLGDLVS